jgi:hypothetical protein
MDGFLTARHGRLRRRVGTAAAVVDILFCTLLAPCLCDQGVQDTKPSRHVVFLSSASTLSYIQYIFCPVSLAIAVQQSHRGRRSRVLPLGINLVEARLGREAKGTPQRFSLPQMGKTNAVRALRDDRSRCQPARFLFFSARNACRILHRTNGATVGHDGISLFFILF